MYYKCINNRARLTLMLSCGRRSLGRKKGDRVKTMNKGHPASTEYRVKSFVTEHGDFKIPVYADWLSINSTDR